MKRDIIELIDIFKGNNQHILYTIDEFNYAQIAKVPNRQYKTLIGEQSKIVSLNDLDDDEYRAVNDLMLQNHKARIEHGGHFATEYSQPRILRHLCSLYQGTGAEDRFCIIPSVPDLELLCAIAHNKTYSKEIHDLYKKITLCFLEEDELRKENPELYTMAFGSGAITKNIFMKYYHPSERFSRWHYLLPIAIFITHIIWSLAMPLKSLTSTLQLLIPATILFLQHIVLCFNVIRRNYIPPVASIDRAGNKQENENILTQEQQIEPLAFARHIEQYKPYLDPNLTIVELAQRLHTNCTYLSGFINRTYGMNYSQFINECRLKELDRIVVDAGSGELTNLEKICLAGFGSFDSYRRAVRMREERIRLKPEE
ncbi:MAG: hypothetical protein LUH50_15090 [Bacteroides intestinalis]|nr:hypothetical protein [Bacteroides intestinalis]